MVVVEIGVAKGKLKRVPKHDVHVASCLNTYMFFNNVMWRQKKNKKYEEYGDTHTWFQEDWLCTNMGIVSLHKYILKFATNDDLIYSLKFS